MSTIKTAVLDFGNESARRIGWSGLLGLVFLALSLLMMLTKVPLLKNESAAVRTQISVAQRDFNKVSSSHPAPLKTSETLEIFRVWFPIFDRNAADLRHMIEEAQLAKLDLDNADYHIADDSDKSLVSYDVVVPVKASYESLRSFIAGVLNALPNSSLVELHIERPSAKNAIQDAKLHFIFFYRRV